jgi:NAD(P)-dependent dehydrogenase (short-subunit alcohol dehydrogenase family)
VTAPVAVITGASAGIGLEAARSLGGLGYRLVLVGRSQTRGETALAELRRSDPTIDARFCYADLSVISEMHRVGAEIAETEPTIQLLVNNAGGMTFDRRVTSDGLERMFAVNHLAYFVITRHLLPSLMAARPARIVSVASAAHRGAVLDFDDLQTTRRYSGMRTYGRTKLANILFTRALARRLDPAAVTANCLHPGFIASSFGNDNKAVGRTLIQLAKQLFAEPVTTGGQRVVYAAMAPELAHVTGAYLVKNKVATPTVAAQDDAAAERLWQVSEELTG